MARLRAHFDRVKREGSVCSSFAIHKAQPTICAVFSQHVSDASTH